ncbi:low temperature requirement protein A [Streptomyces sp. NPDC058401]|uniref:low temperature requirement protein A n=1 Tax=Streptomyces sp. NPDC058401 TaxID=3346480 RepID=UPI0036635B8D
MAKAVRETAEKDSEAVEERHASWLELFFDLLFVAVVAQLAHGLLGHVTLARIGEVLALFVPAWWAWVAFTYFSNSAQDDGPVRRFSVLANMACLVVMGGGVAGALHGNPALFAIGYTLSRTARTVEWLIAVRRLKGGLPPLRTYGLNFLSIVLWAVSAALSAPVCYLLWAVGIAAEITSAMISARYAKPPIDVGHMAERFGLFVIIALGEGIAQIVGALGSSPGPTHVAVLTAVAGFALAAAIWWGYFDFGNQAAAAVVAARPRAAYRLAVHIFTLGHFLLVASILAIDAGLGSAVTDASGGAAHGTPTTDSRLVCAGLWVHHTNNAVLSLTELGATARSTAAWWVPDTLVLAAVWLAADHLHPGAVFAILTCQLALTLFFGGRQRAPALLRSAT